jgi:hypothetical protein
LQGNIRQLSPPLEYFFQRPTINGNDNDINPSKAHRWIEESKFSQE